MGLSTASLSGNAKIVLKGDFSQWEEGPVSGTPKPGTNMKRGANARVFERDTWKAGSTDYVGTGTGVTTQSPPVCVLCEDSLQGKTIDDAYVDGENGFIFCARPGDVVQVRVASGQTVTKGKGLSAGTTGLWVTDATNAPVEALESSSGALGADTLVRAVML